MDSFWVRWAFWSSGLYAQRDDAAIVCKLGSVQVQLITGQWRERGEIGRLVCCSAQALKIDDFNILIKPGAL